LQLQSKSAKSKPPRKKCKILFDERENSRELTELREEKSKREAQMAETLTCMICLEVKRHSVGWPVCLHSICVVCLHKYLFSSYTSESKNIRETCSKLWAHAHLTISDQNVVEFMCTPGIDDWKACPKCRMWPVSFFHDELLFTAHPDATRLPVSFDQLQDSHCPYCAMPFQDLEVSLAIRHMLSRCPNLRLPCPLGNPKCSVPLYPRSKHTVPLEWTRRLEQSERIPYALRFSLFREHQDVCERFCADCGQTMTIKDALVHTQIFCSMKRIAKALENLPPPHDIATKLKTWHALQDKYFRLLHELQLQNFLPPAHSEEALLQGTRFRWLQN
jgi:hypothetical protein